MDSILTEFFDPNSYHSHIIPLESSAQAIRIAQQAKRIDRSRRGKRPVGTDSRVLRPSYDDFDVPKGTRDSLSDIGNPLESNSEDLEDATARVALGDLARWLPVRPEDGARSSRSPRVGQKRITMKRRGNGSRSSRTNSLSRYYTTSALVRSMYPEPKSGKARQLMVNGGHTASCGHESPLHSIMREPVAFGGESEDSRQARATRKKLGRVALDKLRSRYEKDDVDVRKYHDRIGILTEMS